MANNFSFVLNLDKININNLTKITKIPDLEIIKLNGVSLYAVKYFITNNHNQVQQIRITSKDKNFKTIYSLDFFDKRLKPAISILIKEETPQDKFIEMISAIGKKKLNESVSPSNLFIESLFLKEGMEKLAYKIQNASALFTGVLMVISIILMFHYYIKDVLNKIEEQQSATRQENELNKLLFSGQKEDEPEFIIYHKIQNYLKTVLNKEMNGLVLYGPPGTSKTYIVRRSLYFSKLLPGKDYNVIKGSTMGLLSFYQTLYINKNKILILDDFDKPLADEDIVNLLKAATDSYANRIISLPLDQIMSSGQAQTKSQTPQKFNFSGQIIIITNLPKNKIDRAILSRIPSVEVSFNTEETLKAVQNMLKYINPSVDIKIKQEVLDYILYLYKKNPNIEVSFRSVKSAIDSRLGNPRYWQDMVEIIVGYN
jgi:hypothetical protein